MLIEDLIRRSAVTIRRGAALAEAARLMEQNEVGLVVVVEGGRVVGILTDRDIAVGGVARGLDCSTTAVDDVMTRNPVCLPARSDVAECLSTMEAQGVRRMPLLNQQGKLTGIVSLDDLLMHLGNQIASAASLIRKEVVFVPTRPAGLEPSNAVASRQATTVPDLEC